MKQLKRFGMHEKDEVKATNEILRGTVAKLRQKNEALCNNRFKFKVRRFSRMKKQERERERE